MNTLKITLVMFSSLIIASLFTSMQLSPDIDPTVNAGYETFLAQPTSYTFKCGCGLGEILDAELAEDGAMTVDYFYPCGGKKLYGRLTGTFDNMANRFEGVYNTEDKMYYGPITFSFNDAGEGRGEWDNGVGTVKMLLK